jgi:hypothetical protein
MNPNLFVFSFQGSHISPRIHVPRTPKLYGEILLLFKLDPTNSGSEGERKEVYLEIHKAISALEHANA